MRRSMDSKTLLETEESAARVFAHEFLERTSSMDEKTYDLHNVDASAANGSNSLDTAAFASYCKGEHLNDDFLRHAAAI